MEYPVFQMVVKYLTLAEVLILLPLCASSSSVKYVASLFVPPDRHLPVESLTKYHSIRVYY